MVTGVYGHKGVWSQGCMQGCMVNGVHGHRGVWSQTVYGHMGVWSQGVWSQGCMVQGCMVTRVYGLKGMGEMGGMGKMF